MMRLGALSCVAILQILCNRACAATPPQFVIDDSPRSSLLNGPVLSTPECNIHAIVRAPDLAPNMKTLGEARLFVKGRANDPGCKVVEWGIGLLLMESVYVRTKTGNSTDDEGWRHANTFLNYFDDTETKPASESWEYQGEQRTLFDSYVQLGRSEDGITLPQSKSFNIATPNTNFPPTSDVPRYHAESSSSTKFHIKKAMAFYATIKFANGFTARHPAGIAAFQPVFVQPSASSDSVLIPLKPSHSRIKVCKTCQRTNGTCAQVGKPKDLELFALPECEKALTNDAAEFSVQLVLPQKQTFIQGQPYNASTVIRRKSHGSSEVVSRLSAFFITDRNYTETARRLVGSDARLEVSTSESQIRAKPIRRQTRKGGEESERTMGSFREGSIQLPPSMNHTITTSLNLIVHSDALPTFEDIYEIHTNVLHISVSTTFACDVRSPRAEDLEEMSWSEQATSARMRRATRTSINMYHTARIPITILSSSLADANSTPPPVHYLDPRAEAPILYLDSYQPEFSTLSPHIYTLNSEEAEFVFKALESNSWAFQNRGPHTGQIWETKLAIERAVKAGLNADAVFEFDE